MTVIDVLVPIKKRSVSQSRAQEFLAWVLTEISKLPPDTCLPPDRELGAQWGLSTITVQRVLAKLRDDGKVVRIPGKGTFTPNLERNISKVMNIRGDTSRESSVDHLAASLIRMISEGVYRKGKSLPPVKFVRSQFRVSSETVTNAYQRMESLGYVEKIGKSYWVGRLDQLLSDTKRQEIIVFRLESADFQSVFTTDPLAPAFQKMERELYQAGFRLRPESIARFEILAAEWETSGRYPAGILFQGINASHLPFFRAFMPRIQMLEKNHVRILMHGQDNDLSELTSMAPVVSRGNIETDCARVLTQFLLNNRATEATLCFRQSELGEPFRSAYLLKIILAVENSIPDFKFRVVIENDQATPSISRNGLVESVNPEYRRYLQSKFPGASIKDLEGRTTCTHDLSGAWRSQTTSRVWIFSRDEAAASALKWLHENGIQVPLEISVIGLQNDPRYYHLGLSTCGPDWDGVGYLMAHTLIGDVKVNRSHSGYLKVRGQMVEKLTTA